LREKHAKQTDLAHSSRNHHAAFLVSVKPLDTSSPSASPDTGRKITRHELAAHLGLSLRYIDELTRNGSLPFYKIGKSIRYDTTEVEGTLRERFHVSAKVRKQNKGGTRHAGK
jgi:excisionase family DNA binding protein